MRSSRLNRVPSWVVMLLCVAGCANAAGGTARRDIDASAAALPMLSSVAAREQTADQQVLHAINRLTFGARPGDAERVRAMGVDRWIAQQLEPSQTATGNDAAIAARYPVLGMSIRTLLDEYPPNPVLRRILRQGGMRPDSMPVTRADSLEYAMLRRRTQVVGQQLVSARVARAVLSERQLDEVLTDFWLNHFNVFAGKNAAMRHYLVAYERDAIRPNVLGKFRTLLGTVAHSPAMLSYLDNWQSAADSAQPRLVSPRLVRAVQRRYVQRAPQLSRMSPGQRDTLLVRLQQRRRGLNENYARELMELHTLGVDGGYTQRDVTEAARILTGWSIRQPNELAEYRFDRALHDAGLKQVMGTAFPAGQGEAEGERLLDLLAQHPATGRHIAFKLAQRFVSDTPPAALVQRAAETFRRSDGDLRAVLRTIVTSEEFFAQAAWRAKVKSPFEVVVSSLRAMGGTIDTTPRTAALVARLGQGLYQHQAPNGWPETGEGWINTGAILNRINFGVALASGRVPGVSLQRWPLYAALDTLPRMQQVDGVVRALLGGDVSSDMRAILLSGAHPMLQAAQPSRGSAVPMRDSLADDDATRTERALQAGAESRGLAQVVGLAIGSPEFQRR